MNPWISKAQERYPHGAVRAYEGKPWRPVAATWKGHFQRAEELPLPTILEHLAYERQECERCDGRGWNNAFPDLVQGTTKRACPTCDSTGLSADYRKAQEWAERLGLEDG